MGLSRVWRWFTQRPGRGGAREHPADEGTRRERARARFWAEFRKGQREAEELSAAPPIGPTTRHG